MLKEKIVRCFRRFEDGNFFVKWYDAQPVSAKLGFYAAVILSLLTHIIIYSNLILEHHSPRFSFAMDMSPFGSGRWFHHRVNWFNFFYMNWVTGLMQVAFLAILVFIIIKAFNIQNRLYALLIAGIMVTFPTLAEFNQIFFDAAPYTMAALLSVAAFYVTKLYKLGWIAGAIMIMLSLAIYQAKFNLTIVASLMHLIIYILNEKPAFLALVKYSLRFLLLIVGGLVAYYVSVLVLNVPLTYQGLGSLTLTGIYNDILRAYHEVYLYFFSSLFRIGRRTITIAYGLVFAASLILFIYTIIKSKGNSIANRIIVVVFILLLPLAANFSRVLDESGIHVLTTTSYAFTLFPILPLILLDNFKVFTFGAKNILAIVLVFIIGFNMSLSNYIYHRGQVITMHTINIANRVAARIEPLLPYSSYNQIFINGNLGNNPIFPDLLLFHEYTPRTVNSVNFSNYDHFSVGFPWSHSENVIRYWVGLDVFPLSPFAEFDLKQHLLDRAITSGMPVYPQEGSVALIDGVVVVMLGFLGRIDIEEIAPDNFIATFSHLGKATDLDFEYTWYIYKDGHRLQQLHTAHSGIDRVNFEVYEYGSYQFKVITTFPDGTVVMETMSYAFGS